MHKKYMQLALDLAKKYRGRTSPNPLVGAIIVKNNKIIGKGAHQEAGKEHAEINALKSASGEVKNATLYVTLEPCSHFGKTPPCTEAIIKSGIKKVVIAMSDPNPLVNGKGIEQLQENGIEVICGVCEKEAQNLNEIFIKYITTGRPFVILKAAMSLDGKIATSTFDAKWISNEISRQKSQNLRITTDAIAIGKNTFRMDNPRLNIRINNVKKEQFKIIIMKILDISKKDLVNSNLYKLSRDKKIILVAEKNGENEKRSSILREIGVKVLLIPRNDESLNLEDLLKKLGKIGITSLLLEGGSGLYNSFIKQDLVDKYHLFYAPLFIGNEGIGISGNLQRKVLNEIKNIEFKKVETLGNNIHLTAYPKRG